MGRELGVRAQGSIPGLAAPSEGKKFWCASVYESKTFVIGIEPTTVSPTPVTECQSLLPLRHRDAYFGLSSGRIYLSISHPCSHLL